MINYILPFLQKPFVDTVSREYNNFLLNLSPIQKQKYTLIQESKLIRYFSVFLDHDSKQMTTPMYNLFDIHCEDYNTEQKSSLQRLVTEKEILKINNLIDTEATNQWFLNTISFIKDTPQKPSMSGFMHFLEGGKVTPHKHDFGCFVFHLLLDDVFEGELNITVNNNLTKLAKKGDYIAFNPYDIHSATLKGAECRLFSLGFNKQFLT